jgi:hypothetical protein
MQIYIHYCTQTLSSKVLVSPCTAVKETHTPLSFQCGWIALLHLRQLPCLRRVQTREITRKGASTVILAPG